MKMKVLSLFDGISCGMVALERAGIPVERYVAYEIEESAIKISKHHYPMIEECGDVFKADFTEYHGFDLLIGGSPCTFWSVARKDRETTSDGFGFELFKQYVRAWKESGCKYFLYENNYSMHKDIVEWLTERRLYVWQEDMPDSMAANHICAEDILENRLDKQSLKKILKESRISGNRIHILNQMIKTSDR